MAQIRFIAEAISYFEHNLLVLTYHIKFNINAQLHTQTEHRSVFLSIP